jgi:hypothetical protein
MTHRDGDGSDNHAGPPAGDPATVEGSSGQTITTPMVPDIQRTVGVLTQLSPLLKHLYEKMKGGCLPK